MKTSQKLRNYPTRPPLIKFWWTSLPWEGRELLPDSISFLQNSFPSPFRGGWSGGPGGVV